MTRTPIDEAQAALVAAVSQREDRGEARPHELRAAARIVADAIHHLDPWLSQPATGNRQPATVCPTCLREGVRLRCCSACGDELSCDLCHRTGISEGFSCPVYDCQEVACMHCHAGRLDANPAWVAGHLEAHERQLPPCPFFLDAWLCTNPSPIETVLLFGVIAAGAVLIAHFLIGATL